jgi:hypothetical protein
LSAQADGFAVVFQLRDGEAVGLGEDGTNHCVRVIPNRPIQADDFVVASVQKPCDGEAVGLGWMICGFSARA